jgi:uncharacterized protein
MPAPATVTASPSRADPVTRLLIALVRVYRLVPKIGPRRCRFFPSCSEYGLVALQRHGGTRGGWLTLRRIARCHPFHPGGVDHVPPERDARTSVRRR